MDNSGSLSVRLQIRVDVMIVKSMYISILKVGNRIFCLF